MANLYDKAGLVNIPVGYQEGFLYNIKPTDNTLGFRFNRDSAATRVNKEGLIEQVGYFGPELVQNGNFSELGPELVVNGDFATDSDWNLTGATISGGKVNVNSSSPIFIVQNNVATVGKQYKVELTVSDYVEGDLRLRYPFTISESEFTGNGTYVFYGTAEDARFELQGRFSGQTYNYSIDNVSVKQVDPNDYWTLGTGWGFGDNKAVFTSGTSGILFQSNIVETGKLYKLTFDVIRTSGFITSVFLGGVSDNTDINQSGSYTYYITSINQDVLGFNADSSFNGSITNISVVEVQGDKPRIDYTDSLTSPSFLLEPQSTNLITYSQDFSQWNTVSGAVVTDNFTTSPDGTQNAAKVVYNGTSLGRIEISTGASGTNTQSIYLKTASGTQTVSIGASSSNLTEVTVTEEWQRFTHTGSGSYPRVLCNDAATIYVWGAQQEELPYATSYIPTAGSTVTRAQETCIGAGNASTFNDSEGVLYAEIAALANDGTSRRISISAGNTNNNNLVSLIYGISNRISPSIYSGGSFQMGGDYTLPDQTETIKVALKYSTNDAALWVNGLEVLTDTSVTTPVGLDQIKFEYGNGSNKFYGKTKGIYVFNEALTDDELQQLTGPEYNSFAALAAAYNYTVI